MTEQPSIKTEVWYARYDDPVYAWMPVYALANEPTDQTDIAGTYVEYRDMGVYALHHKTVHVLVQSPDRQSTWRVSIRPFYTFSFDTESVETMEEVEQRKIEYKTFLSNLPAKGTPK